MKKLLFMSALLCSMASVASQNDIFDEPFNKEILKWFRIAYKECHTLKIVPEITEEIKNDLKAVCIKIDGIQTVSDAVKSPEELAKDRAELKEEVLNLIKPLVVAARLAGLLGSVGVRQMRLDATVLYLQSDVKRVIFYDYHESVQPAPAPVIVPQSVEKKVKVGCCGSVQVRERTRK